MIKKLSMILGMVILILLFSGISESQVTYYVNIHSSAFRAGNDVVDADFYSNFANAENTGYLGYAEFFAPVQLPDGAKYKKIYLYCYDFHASYGIELSLYRVSIYDGHVEQLFYASTSFAPGYTTISDADLNITGGREVENKKWAYVARIRVNTIADNLLRWYNFKLRYEL